MATERWRIELIEETEDLPVPWRPATRYREAEPPPEDRAMAALLEAIDLLARRGPGAQGWSAPFRQHPIAFLLDTMSDAINLWSAGGELLYRNQAAGAIGLGRCEEAPLEILSAGGRRFERRCLRCRFRGTESVLEIIREI